MKVVLRNSITLETACDESGNFAFEGVPSGKYTIELPEKGMGQVVEVPDGDTVSVEFQLPEPAEPEEEHTEEPSKPEEEPKPVEPEEPEHKTEEETPEEHPQPIERWTYKVEQTGIGPGFGVIRCSVKGRKGVKIRVWADGWSGETVESGSKPEYGPYACELSPLGSGRYYLSAEELGIDRIIVNLDGVHVVWVTFAPAQAEPEKEEKLEDEEKSTPVSPVHGPAKEELYLFLAEVPIQKSDLLMLMNYISKFSPKVGDSVEEAGKSEKVVVISGSVDDALRQILEGEGAKVCFAAPPFSGNLEEALSSGDATAFCEG